MRKHVDRCALCLVANLAKTIVASIGVLFHIEAQGKVGI